MRSIQQKYGADKERMNAEMTRMYIEEKINPLQGFATAIVQIPLFVSLYKSIIQLSEQDVHFKESFLWIPSMVGPQYSQTYGMSWLTSLQNGAPEMGWSQAALYLIAPAILIAIQITIQAVNSPPIREQTFATRSIQLIPFMSGLTALASPAGMSVYWVTNAALSLVQSVTVRNKLRGEGLDMWEMDRLQKEEFEREAKFLEQQKAKLDA